MSILPTLFSTLLSGLLLAARRLWNQRLLGLCLLAGLVAAVGLLSSIPLYADAVHHELLRGELTEAGTYRPPFAFLWRYVGAWHGDVTWDSYRPVDKYLSEQAAGAIGLPLESLVRHVKTGNLRLFAAEGSGAFANREPLMWTSVGFVSGIEAHIELVDGGLAAFQEGEGVPILVTQSLAERLGLQTGERYVLFGDGQAQVPVTIAGIWRPLDPTDPFWFYQVKYFDDLLLTSEEMFVEGVVPALNAPVSQAVWYQAFDGEQVRTAAVDDLLARISTVRSRATALLADTSLDASPVDALESYRQSASLLTVVLTMFSIPIVGLLLYFVSLIAGMVVRRSQGEIAILRSRGTTRGQIALIYLLEGLLVGVLGMAGGLALGRRLAALMGQTRTFLDPALFGSVLLPGSPLSAGSTGEPGSLSVVLTPTAVWYGLLGVALAVLALLLPALAASRHTIVTFRWERARALLRPVYQRYFLDLLLLALPLYGWYLLTKQGTIAPIYQSTNLPISQSDPFSNPLLFLVPALFCFSLALLFIRFFPLVMGALAWLASQLPGTALLLTLRQLARAAGQYTGPLLLLALTLSLAAFSASMAVTLDDHLADRVYYQVGADLNLAELGESTEQPEQPGLFGGAAASDAPDNQGPRWLFLPVSEHLQVPGVLAAARVGDYSAASNLDGRQQPGRLLGVDRLDFASVAYYRPDFASGESLGGLMNRLAADPAHVLVSRNFLARYGLSVGDPLRLTVGAAGEFHDVQFTVAGPLDLFPTLYPQDGPFFVANLDHVYQGLGGTFPYDVWLATDPAVPAGEIVAGVRDLRLAVVSSSGARDLIAAEQTRPERQGLFGLLTAGFLASAVLTVLGFLVYAVVSFRRRFIELGTLRAVGLSVGQMAAYLAGEQAILILTGAGLGTVLGVTASRLFIPYLQVGAGKTAQVPPFVVQIAWQELLPIYYVFGAIFLAAVAALIVLLLRMRIFEAIKLGEAG
ncbi:MAG: FtsX-like permease family protein [Anaerolineae bacterium]|jgi:putative ABC transport system permease protein|nr:FtsX-like permease family protein [Anaerolineae bacterium]